MYKMKQTVNGLQICTGNVQGSCDNGGRDKKQMAAVAIGSWMEILDEKQQHEERATFVMSQRHHLNDFPWGRITGKLEEGCRIINVAVEFEMLPRVWR